MEDYEGYEDPAIKGQQEHLGNTAILADQIIMKKRLYNYVYRLQTRILCRIKLILVPNQYITKYITEYPSNNEYNQYFQSRQNADKILKILI